jgi:YHS domain-containing protein
MKILLSLITITTLLIGGLALAEEPVMKLDMKMADSEMKMPASSYPIDFCVVSGEKLGSMGDPIKYQHEGREVQFCCGGCIASFEKDPAKYLAALDVAIVKAQSESYPLDICPISGEKLGGMGDPIDIVYNDQLVRFCCNGCTKDFYKNPDKYLKMVADARQAKSANGEQMKESMIKKSPTEQPTGHEGHNH